MRSRDIAIVVAALAGACAAARAQPIPLHPTPVSTGVFKGNPLTGSMYTTRDLRASAYDNMGAFADSTPGVVETQCTGGSPPVAADYYFLGNVADAGDYVTLDRNVGGRGKYGDKVISYVDWLYWGIAYNGDGSNPEVLVDDYHLFYDDLVTWDTGGSLTDITRGCYLGGFYLACLAVPDFNNSGLFYAYVIDQLLDSGITIVVDDNFLVYRHIISLTGSGGSPVVDSNGLTVYNGDGTVTGTDGENYLGASIDLFLADTDASGEFNANEWLYYYGGTPFVANLMINIGMSSCIADVDGSGFVDLDDFDFFVLNFQNGC